VHPAGGSQDDEYAALRLAQDLAGDEPALTSISIGGPQILIANHTRLGYDSAREMYEAFQASEAAQLLGFADFCEHDGADGDTLQQLRDHDWPGFARRYNGTGQVASYATRLESAYGQASQLFHPERTPATERLDPETDETPRQITGQLDPETDEATWQTTPGNGEPGEAMAGHGRDLPDPALTTAILAVGLDRLFSRQAPVVPGQPFDLGEGRTVEVVAAPRGYLASPAEPGDLLVRQIPGEKPAVTVLNTNRLYDAATVASAAIPSESILPGRYVTVRHDGEPRLRRLVDAEGRMPPGQALVRPTRPTWEEGDAAHADSGGGSGSPATTPWHELGAHLGGDADIIPAAFTPDGEEGGGSGDAGAVSVEPFPATARTLSLADNRLLPPLSRNDKLAGAMQALEADPDTKDMCVAVVDLRPGPPDGLYQGYNDHDMLYVGSLQKISPMYVAFELRARVRKHVKAAVATGLTVNAADWKKMQADIRAAWQPKLDAAFSAPRRPGFPDLANIFRLTPPDKVHFTPSFRDSLTQMVKCSDNQEASKCILALSYPYINGVLGAAGFFQPAGVTAAEGLWISGNYHNRAKNWIPDRTVDDANAGQIKTARWQTITTPPRIKTNFAATAQQVARMYALLAQDRLVNNADPDANVADPDTNKEIRALLALAEHCAPSFIGRILREAHHPLDAIFSKIGIDQGDDFVHDGGIVERTLGGVSSRYVVVALGMNNDLNLLKKVFLTIDTALS
jgi:hypothetical protein